MVSVTRLDEVTTVVHTDDVVPGDEKPSVALRARRTSSMRLAINAVKEGRAGALVGVSPVLDPTSGMVENLVGYGTRLAERHHHLHGMDAGECIVVISNSGKNSAPIEIAIRVDLSTVDPAGLSVYVFDAVLGRFVQLPAEVGLDGFVRFHTSHLSLFAILELPTVERVLRAGWNVIMFTGPTDTSAAAFAASIPGLQSIWRWNAATQTWEGFRPEGPAFLNALQLLEQRDPLFVLLSASSNYRSMDLLAGSGTAVSIVQGFSFLSYNGADDRDLEDLLGGVAGIESAFLFDAIAQQYLTFRFAGPAFLNGFTTIDRLQAIFIFRR